MQRLLSGCWLLLWALLAGSSPPAYADGLVAIPALTARVTDTTGTLTAAQIAQLEAELAAFEASKGSQIAVLIVPSTQPEPIESYSLRVVEAWKLGRRKVDDGVLLVVAKNDRRLRIEVGYGLEGALTDAGSRRIIAETITPRFKAGDFFGGIEAGVRQIIAVVSGEALPEVSVTGPESAAPREVLGGLILLVSGVLSALLGRLLPWPVRMLTASVLATVVGVMMSSFLLAILCFFGFLFFGSRAGSSFVTTAGNAGAWRGGGGFGGGGSFGGGGGFSGGGGGFGGGGSSGSW